MRAKFPGAADPPLHAGEKKVAPFPAACPFPGEANGCDASREYVYYTKTLCRFPQAGKYEPATAVSFRNVFLCFASALPHAERERQSV